MERDLIIVGLVAMFGAIIGSFLSVCIYRLPLRRFSEDPGKQKMRLWFPARSVCPACDTQLKWWHNIPIFSWLFLMGRCAFCKKSISVRYPLVEALSAGCAAFSYIRFDLSPTFALVYLFCAVMIVVAFIDIDYMIIPDIISIPGIWLGILVSLIQGALPEPLFDIPVTQSLKDGGMGLFVGYGLFRAAAELYLWLRQKEGLGLGDVKLLGMIGAFFGLQCVLITIFLSSFLGIIGGVLLLLLTGRGFDQPMPFGPYIIIAALIFILGVDHSQYQLVFKF